MVLLLLSHVKMFAGEVFVTYAKHDSTTHVVGIHTLRPCCVLTTLLVSVLWTTRDNVICMLTGHKVHVSSSSRSHNGPRAMLNRAV